MIFLNETEKEALRLLGEQFVFPDTYLALDTETTGFSRTQDYIIDAGWAVIKDRQIVNQESLLIDWSKLDGVNCSVIQQKLIKQAEDYAEMGRPHYYPWERLKDEGEHPLDVLYAYASLIYEHVIRDDSIIVGHGFWKFDREMIDSHTFRFLKGWKAPWKHNSIFDTGLTEKALQMNRPPTEVETLDDWLRKINGSRMKGVYWSMDRHCEPKYQLSRRFDGVDMSQMHTAGFDCTLIHHLLETFRQLFEVIHGQRDHIDGEDRVEETTGS